MDGLFFLALALFLAGLGLLWRSRSMRRSAGLPGGRVVYSDTSKWASIEEPLYSAELGLTGKPDYLVEKAGKFIPVEVKSGRIPEGPYDSHIFQLAAYCLLVTKIYEKRPPYGLLHYTSASGAARTFAVDFTPALEAELVELLEEMRAQERRKEIPRSHETAARCKGCGFSNICDQRLT
jgi:CRISPR-associated exonuclease Cas4